MAIYYVDLDEPTRPASTGTIANPFGTEQYRTMAGGIGPHTFNLRGSGELLANLTNGGGHTHRAWDVVLYGPWRIHANAFGYVGANNNVYIDGVIETAALAGLCNTLVRCHIRVSWFQCQADIYDCNLLVTNDINLFAAAPTEVVRCVINLDGAIIRCNGAAATTFTDCVTNVANFAALATNAGGAPIDGGGNVYNTTFDVPVWNESDPEAFCLYSHRGVGTYGDWAFVEPPYTNLSIADGFSPVSGTPDHPVTLALFAAYLGGFAIFARTYKIGGTRVLTGGVAPAFTANNLTFDGYDITDPTKADAWRINGMVGGLGCGAFDGNHYTFKRLALHQGTIGFTPANDNYAFRFKNCYLRHASSINLHIRYGMTMEWFGCTYYTPLINIHYCGLSTWRFRDCVFYDTVFSSDYDATIEFTNCWFTTKTQAQIEAAIGGPVSFVGCSFAQPYVQFPPEVVDVNATTMAYSRFALPYLRVNAARLADWAGWAYDHGFDDNVRQGIGAFYFALPVAGFVASPDSGYAPLTVRFIPNWDNGDPTGWSWDFGDGGTSNEASPEHVYTMPGSWIPTLVVTFSNGSVVTVVGSPIYVYEYDYEAGVPNPSRTDTCYRTPVKPGDGFGPSEYRDGLHQGYDWVWPPARVGVAICYDEQNREQALVWDAKTQLRWKVNDPDSWEDRQGRAGYAGQQIISEIHHKADSASQGEHVAIVHNESHSYFKPFDVARIGEAGYDAAGYPSDMSIDDMVHVDGNPTEFTRSRDIPKDGDVVYQERVEGRSIQLRKRVYSAPWWYTGVQPDYETIDKAARPTLRQMTEEGYQQELVALPLFHVSRNPNPVLNMATGMACVGGTVAATATGPDGKAYSGVLFSTGADGLSDALAASLGGDFTIQWWMSRTHMANLPARIWQIGSLLVRVLDVGGARMLQVSDGVNGPVLVALSGAGLDWACIALVRATLAYKVYENGRLLGTFPLVAAVDYGTALSRCGGDGVGMFDACVLPRAVTVDALEYYYEDVLRGGRQVLPEY